VSEAAILAPSLLRGCGILRESRRRHFCGGREPEAACRSVAKRRRN